MSYGMNVIRKKFDDFLENGSINALMMISNATIEFYKYQPIRYASYIPALEDSTNQICFLYSNSNQTKEEWDHHVMVLMEKLNHLINIVKVYHSSTYAYR